METTSNSFQINSHLLFKQTVVKLDAEYIPPYHTVKGTLCNYKKRRFPEAPSSFKDVPEESTYYYGDNDIKFLLYKSETTMIFTTKRAMTILANGDELFIDDTFKCVPTFFYQTVVIHSYYKSFNYSFPCLFAFLKGNRL